MPINQSYECVMDVSAHCLLEQASESVLWLLHLPPDGRSCQPNPDGRSVSRARDSAYVLLLLFHLVTGCRSSILVRARRARCSYKYRRHSINCTIRESSRQDHLMHQLATTTTAAARVCLMSRKNTNSQLLVNSNARFPLDMRTGCTCVCHVCFHFIRGFL